MGRHVITSLYCVDKVGLIFRNKPVEKGFKIASDSRIGILVDHQTSRGVFNEYMQQTFLRKIGKVLLNNVGYEMQAPGEWWQLYFKLLNHKTNKTCKMATNRCKRISLELK